MQRHCNQSYTGVPYSFSAFSRAKASKEIFKAEMLSKIPGGQRAGKKGWASELLRKGGEESVDINTDENEEPCL